MVLPGLGKREIRLLVITPHLGDSIPGLIRGPDPILQLIALNVGQTYPIPIFVLISVPILAHGSILRLVAVLLPGNVTLPWLRRFPLTLSVGGDRRAEAKHTDH
jgi:hypothetical protein